MVKNMKDILASVIGHLKSLSSAELAAEFAKHRYSDIARTLAHIDSISDTASYGLEKVFAIIAQNSFTAVLQEDFESYTVECAANDERFALAA